MFDALMKLLSPAVEREKYLAKLERRCSELIAENAGLARELTLLNDPGPQIHTDLSTKYEKAARLRVTNLKSAIARLLSIMESQWCGGDEQATLRTARAIMENEIDGVG